jgi:thiol-disulfide isomerase/thioredoxin
MKIVIHSVKISSKTKFSDVFAPSLKGETSENSSPFRVGGNTNFQRLRISLFIKKSILLFSFFISSSFFLCAQNVTIKGNATGAAGKMLCVYSWSDQLTYVLEKVASGKIDSSGKFEFTFKNDKTFFAYLKIDFNQAPIYIEPDKTYNLDISCPDCNSPDDKTNPYLEPKQLYVTIKGTDSLELNNAMIRFNKLYDDFLLKNFILLIKQRNKTLVDSFKVKIDKRFALVNNEYFKTIVRYRFAMIEQSAQLNTKEGLSKKYFWNQPVLYDNMGYMEFFDEFFKGYINAESRHITRDDLERTINTEKSFPALLDSLGKDTLLRNEVIRELVALKGLGELYYTQQYDRTAILDMYRYVKENSKFSLHKKIAENYLNYFTKLAPGTAAPGFTLKDYSGQSYSLSELNKGKYLYLFFWTTWCIPCASEMNLIGKLMEKYGLKVEFVGISTDKEFMTYYYFMQKNKKFDFITLHWGNKTELLENYEVRAYPLFVLIGPDGNIVQCPAENPSGTLDALLYDLTKKK